VVLTARIPPPNGGAPRQVEIRLPGGYAISPRVLSAVRAIPGVAGVKEI